MNYVVVDFEFNQAYDFVLDQKTKSNPECPFEIIQIGAVKLNANYVELDRLNITIKPTVYPRLNPYVSKLTGLTDEILDNSPFKTFEDGAKEFGDFCSDDRTVLCVWGKNDVNTLFRNLDYHKIQNLKLPKEYINLQEYTSKKLKHFSGTHIGLKNAIEQLGITLGLDYHDALNDALYTAEIFKVYKKTRIPIAKYTKPKQPRRHHGK